MEAQINLFLDDDGSFTSIIEGSALCFSSMLYAFGSNCDETKSSLFLATAELIEKEGNKDIADFLYSKAQNAFQNEKT